MKTAAVPTRLVGNSRERMMVTPEGIALPLTLASRGTRFAALIIDLTIISLTMAIVQLLIKLTGIGVLVGDGTEADDRLSALAFLSAIYIVVMFLYHYAYFLYFELGPRGATLGKRITGIRIAARDGGRLSAEMVITRNILRDIELLVPAFILGQASDGGDLWVGGLAATAWLLFFWLFPFFNRDRLRAGDLIAGTWVVEVPKRKLEAAMSRVVARPVADGHAYSFGEAELAVYGEYELQTLERVLRERRPEAVTAVSEAICRKIGWTPPAPGGELPFLEAYYTQLRARLEAGMRFGRRKADKYQ